MLTPKKETYEMDHNAADAALQSILAACDKEPNTIPFEKLTHRFKNNTTLYTVMLILTGVLFFATLLAPLYIPPIIELVEPYFAPEPVVLINDYVEDNILYLEFTGDNIQFEKAYMKTNDNRIENVLSYDVDTGVISFPYYDNIESNIYIPVKGSETLQFLVTLDK